MSCIYIFVEVGVLFFVGGLFQMLIDNEVEWFILLFVDIYYIFIIFVILVINIYLLFMYVIDFIYRLLYENMGIDKFLLEIIYYINEKFVCLFDFFRYVFIKKNDYILQVEMLYLLLFFYFFYKYLLINLNQVE